MPITKLNFFSLLLVYSLFGCHAQANITLGSTLTAGPNSTSWLSASADFAFGFYRLANGLFLLGIWFDKIPDKTLIWSANRDTPAPAGSTLSLTDTGGLVLTQPNGTANPIYNGTAAKSASMQNDGNFVLKNSASKVLWQSFDSPTDTILPGQTLVLGQSLYSNANGTVDFSKGRFTLIMQKKDGNVFLSAFQFADTAYWYTGTLQPNVSLVFNQTTALMYLVNLTGIIYPMTSIVPTPIDNYYHRATIEDTGNFQQFVYPKENGKNWTSVWSAVTEPCTVNGICGVYGYCTSPNNQTANCSCLPGYSLLDPNVPSKGCYPVVPPEQCSKTPSLHIEYNIQEIDGADLPNDGFADMGRVFNSDLESCKKTILDDCYCMAGTLIQDEQSGLTCSKKRIPFFNARKSSPSTAGKTILIKVPVLKEAKSRSRLNLKLGLVTSISLCSFFAVIALYYHPLSLRCGLRKLPPRPNTAATNLRAYTYQELHEATDGFSKQLGRGGYGAVYSGAISAEDNKQIAVKKLEKVMEQGEKEFFTEVGIIGKTHHKNLVRLLGYCNEKNHRILVYELMKNGPVSGFLFGEGEKQKPNWDCRANMVIGIAQGLLYLHEECETQIIHCDIKPQNVLLDNRYNAKISDFGVAKLLMKDQTRTDTDPRGTMGYMAPEWLKNAPVTAKVDVYSFGVMLLEIICCRRQIELKEVEEETDGDDLFLTDLVLSCLRKGKLAMVVKHDPEVLNDFKRFERMAMVGLWCIDPDPILRPSMKKVTQMLEGTIEVGVPPLAMNAQLL